MSFASGLRSIVVASGRSGRLEAAFCVPPELALAETKSEACVDAEVRQPGQPLKASPEIFT